MLKVFRWGILLYFSKFTMNSICNVRQIELVTTDFVWNVRRS
jgi:hypothetical protein